jgi:mono/diheme cytochrome c family protein
MESSLMKYVKALLVIAAFSTSMAFADDAAALYKAKCAMCHGPNGEGKIGAKLQGTAVSEAQIVDMLTKGVAGKKAPHSKPLASVTADQAKALAAYVKTLK